MDLGEYGIWWSGWRDDDGFIEAAAEMEQLGYGTLWMSGGFVPGLLPRFESVLAASSHAVVATGILNIWLTPAAEHSATFADLETRYPGRFLMGLGVSHAPVVEGSGQPYVQPYTKMVSYLDDLDAAGVVPPGRRVLAALKPKMLELAAERSLGAHPYFTTVDHTAFARGVLGSEAVLAPEVAVVIDEDPAQARASARRYMALYLSLPNYASNLARFGFSEDDLSEGGSDRLIDALIPWGSADVVAGKLRAHKDAGADHICVQIVGSADGFPVADYRRLARALSLAD